MTKKLQLVASFLVMASLGFAQEAKETAPDSISATDEALGQDNAADVFTESQLG